MRIGVVGKVTSSWLVPQLKEQWLPGPPLQLTVTAPSLCASDLQTNTTTTLSHKLLFHSCGSHTHTFVNSLLANKPSSDHLISNVSSAFC